MPDWTLHWLEAEGSLCPWQSQIAVEIEAARQVIATVILSPRLDILIQRLSRGVIPEIGMVGHAYRKSLFSLTMDPDNAKFERCLMDGTLRRQVAHEVHHCLRMAGPGYGRTLGEALVSEGLAGQFVTFLFKTPPEPWECAVDAEALNANMPDKTELASTEYDHGAWFYGLGDKRPRWLGYTLGYHIVGKWLQDVGDVGGDMWTNVSAEAVLSAAFERATQT